MVWGLLLAGRLAAAAEADEAPHDCSSCAEWNTPQAPFPLVGREWYVGPEGLSVVAVDTGDGVVLLDGALPQSVRGIASNLRAVGLDVADVRYILVSHAHYDHVGGVAALQRLSGATVVGTAGGISALRAGGVPADDPQHGSDPASMAFPPVTGPTLVLGDREVLEVGDRRFTLLATPGHTPGGASWSFQSCPTAGACLDIVYADSLNPVSAEGFRFSDDPAALARFRASIEAVGSAECDVLVAVHPSFADLFDRAARPGGLAAYRGAPCREYAADATRRLHKRLRTEARGG